MTYVSEMKHARTTQWLNMCFHIDMFIRNYAEIFKRSIEWYRMPIKLVMNQIKEPRIATWGPHQNNPGLIWVLLPFKRSVTWFTPWSPQRIPWPSPAHLPIHKEVHDPGTQNFEGVDTVSRTFYIIWSTIEADILLIYCPLFKVSILETCCDGQWCGCIISLSWMDWISFWYKVRMTLSTTN